MDIIFIIVMWVVIEYTLKKHNVSNGKEGLNVIGGLMASFFLLGLTRIPIYLFLYGCRFPFHPSDTAVTLSGVFAIVFWGTMLWWRIPGRVVRAICPPKLQAPVNPYPRMPKIDPPDSSHYDTN